MDILFTQDSWIFFAVSVVGILIHVAVKWLRNELTVSPFDYLFKVNPKASALMFGSAIGAVATGILAGQFVDSNSGAQILAVWGIGYAADSALNRQQ